MKLLMTAASAVLLLSVRICHAQPITSQIPRDSMLVHVDTPAVLGRGALSGRLDVRAFGGDEDLVYVGLALHYGVGNGWEGILRGAFADRRTLDLPSASVDNHVSRVSRQSGSAIKHGGNDVELALRYQPAKMPNVAGQIGVSIPGTPAQSDSFLTLGGMVAARLGDRATVYLNPRAVFIDSNTTAGIGIGAKVRVTDQFFLVGDYTPIISGDNTRDTTTGDRKRRDVYGVALRFGPANGSVTIDLGYANGVGSTTGFGLTAGLGGSGAFYFSLTARH